MNYKKSILTGLLAVSFITIGLSQDKSDSKPTSESSNWKLESIFSLNVTQSSFTNWASGGRNNIAGLAFINANADYTKGKWKWANHLSTSLGGIKYFDSDIEKTDDFLKIQSTLSYGIKKPWYLSLMGGFRTQYLDGYMTPTDSLYSSAFMAPAYTTLALGIQYIPNDNLSIMLSPLTGKFTFVMDQRLADAGAFGVTPATYDNLGVLLTHGENIRTELGAYFRFLYQKALMENITLKSRLELFSNYMKNPQNIDVYGQVILNFKINKWFSANLQLNVIYDDDIDIRDKNGNVGPRTQFKEVIGLGISYRLANFEPK